MTIQVSHEKKLGIVFEQGAFARKISEYKKKSALYLDHETGHAEKNLQ